MALCSHKAFSSEEVDLRSYLRWRLSRARRWLRRECHRLRKTESELRYNPARKLRDYYSTLLKQFKAPPSVGSTYVSCLEKTSLTSLENLVSKLESERDELARRLEHPAVEAPRTTKRRRRGQTERSKNYSAARSIANPLPKARDFPKNSDRDSKNWRHAKILPSGKAELIPVTEGGVKDTPTVRYELNLQDSGSAVEAVLRPPTPTFFDQEERPSARITRAVLLENRAGPTDGSGKPSAKPSGSSRGSTRAVLLENPAGSTVSVEKKVEHQPSSAAHVAQSRKRPILVTSAKPVSQIQAPAPTPAQPKKEWKKPPPVRPNDRFDEMGFWKNSSIFPKLKE